jgi:hypothetical protein
MKKCIRAFMMAFLFCSTISAQDSEYLSNGLIRTYFTLNISRSLSFDEVFVGGHGMFEKFVSERLSISGDYYFTPAQMLSSRRVFDVNNSVFLGANYHWGRKRSDVYVGLQPGLSVTKLEAVNHGLIFAEPARNPLFSIMAGYSFFEDTYFYFFFNSRLVLGKHYTNRPINLSELRFSVGIGLHFNSLKKRNRSAGLQP